MNPEPNDRLYPFLSRLLDMPPDAAAISFDFALSHLGRAGALVVDGPVRRATPVGYGPLRTAPGQVFPSRWPQPRVPVVVELLPWSHRRSELALMPLGRRWPEPGRRWVRAYVTAADDVLDLLGALMLTLHPEWLEATATGEATLRQPLLAGLAVP